MEMEMPAMRASSVGATKNVTALEIPDELREELERRKAASVGSNWTKDEWKAMFERYIEDIRFAKRLLDKGSYREALFEVDELLALAASDTGIQANLLVNNFFVLQPDLKTLKKDVSLPGFELSERPFWADWDNDKSLFYFKKTDSIRAMCIKVDESKAFDNFILGVIFVGTCIMAIDSPYEYPDGSTTSDIFDVFDLLINIIFTVEMLIRIVAKSFWFGPNAYLQDGWYRFDFMIVIFSWLALMDGMPNFKPFRAFRGLRALKSIKFLTYCAAVMDALIESGPQFGDVGFLTLFLMLIFGIMGIQLLKCSLKQHCVDFTGEPMSNSDTNWCNADLYNQPGFNDNNEGRTCPRAFECIAGENPNFGRVSFDNIGMAMFSLFQMLTLEGWTPIMYAAMMAESQAVAAYFFVIIVIFAFVVVNLFIAVITTAFQNIRRRRDKDQQIAELRLGQLKLLREANMEGAVGEEADPETANLPGNTVVHTTPEEQIEILLESAGMEQYYVNVLELVDKIADLAGVTQEDLEQVGVKPVHARTILGAGARWLSVLPVSADHKNRSQMVDMDHLPPKQQILYFLKEYSLERYYKEVTKLCDDMNDVRGLTTEDMANSAIKVPHQRKLIQAAREATLTKVDKDDLVARNPLLKEALGGESVAMWRNRMILTRPFWSSKFGLWLLSVWRNQDPMVDMNSPPAPAPREKFMEPYQWDNKCGRIISQIWFESSIQVAIVINIVFMAMEYHNQPDGYGSMLQAMEVVFCFVFVGEMILKMTGMGLMFYFEPFMNKFDFVLVMSSIPSAIAIMFGTQELLNLSLLRVFRLFRMFRMMRDMRQLIDVVASSMMAISNLLVFIIFNLMLFAIFGMQLFAGNVKDEDGELPRANFNNFPISCLSLFQVMTGEDWTTIMYDLMRYSPEAGAIFMVLFFVLANFILMEMFVAVILENFQLEYGEKLQLQQALLGRKIRAETRAKMIRERLDKEKQLKNAAQQEQDDKAEEERLEAQIRAKNLGLELKVDPEEERRRQLEKEQKEKAERELEEAMRAEAALEEEGNGIAGNDLLSDFDAQAGMLEEEPSKQKKKSAGVIQAESSEFVLKSCGVFSEESQIRQICSRINSHPAFEWTIFVIIITGSILLAMETPWQVDPNVTALVAILDPTFLAIFIVEASIKIIAMGFYGKPSAYIMDTWNRIDFFVVVMSVVALIFSDLPGAIPRVLRVFRCIRPLRLINQNENVKKVFDALFMSAPAIANVLFLGFFTVFLFSVMGMGLYMGLFYRCQAAGEDVEVTTRDECLGFSTSGDYPVPTYWKNPTYSFDNVFKGMLTLFEVSTLEGWTDVMYSCMDATSENHQPVKDESPLQCLYLVLYISVCPFFVLNMVIGVIIEKFNQISGRGILTDEQKVFKDTMTAVAMSEGSPPLDRPEGKLRGTCFDITTAPAFEKLVLVLIIANSAMMASEHCGQSDGWEDMLKISNLLFVAIFTVEITLRLVAQYPRSFFRNGWQCFDFAIVIGCLIMIPLDGIVNLQALRPFRLMLVFRMIKRASGIKMMVGVLLMSLPAVFNVSSLLFLSFFIYAVLGMQFFALVKFGNAIHTLANFRTFGNSISLLFRGITGESWNGIMHDLMVTGGYGECTDFFGQTTDGWGDLSIKEVSSIRSDDYWWIDDCGNYYIAIFYWITFIFVGAYAVMNLFIAVILDNFAFVANYENAEISEFALKRFHEIWYKHSKKDRNFLKHGGKYLGIFRLQDFLSDLGQPLGILVWDADGRKKYKMIIAEARRQMDDKGFGISYRKMQLICANYAMNTDIFPLEEKYNREKFVKETAEHRAAALVQGMWKGKVKRQRLGVKATAHKSEAESKAAQFKLRFVELLNDPSQLVSPRSPMTPAVEMKSLSVKTDQAPLLSPATEDAVLSPDVAPAQTRQMRNISAVASPRGAITPRGAAGTPRGAARGAAVGTPRRASDAPAVSNPRAAAVASPSSPPDSPGLSPSPKPDIQDVRNVFRERAMKRREAKNRGSGSPGSRVTNI